MNDSHYNTIDAWDELITKIYGKDGKCRIEKLIERMELGLVSWLPKWTILIGPPRTGKSTLISIIWRMFEGQELFVAGFMPYDLGQYNGILGVCHDGDVNHMYKEIKENWKLSTDYHLLVATNKEPTVDIQESHEIIRPTGNIVNLNRYVDLMEIISKGISELNLYFREKASADFIERSL